MSLVLLTPGGTVHNKLVVCYKIDDFNQYDICVYADGAFIGRVEISPEWIESFKDNGYYIAYTNIPPS